MNQKQGLAWTMIRETRRAFILIDRDQDNRGKCEGVSKAVWNQEEGICLRLFQANGRGGRAEYSVVPADAKIVSKLSSEPYNVDLIEAYTNAYHCWKDNGERPAHPDTSSEAGDGQAPKCFFGMVVKSGRRQGTDAFVDGDDNIVLDGWLSQRDGNTWVPSDDKV